MYRGSEGTDKRGEKAGFVLRVGGGVACQLEKKRLPGNWEREIEGPSCAEVFRFGGGLLPGNLFRAG